MFDCVRSVRIRNCSHPTSLHSWNATKYNGRSSYSLTSWSRLIRKCTSLVTARQLRFPVTKAHPKALCLVSWAQCLPSLGLNSTSCRWTAWSLLLDVLSIANSNLNGETVSGSTTILTLISGPSNYAFTAGGQEVPPINKSETCQWPAWIVTTSSSWTVPNFLVKGLRKGFKIIRCLHTLPADPWLHV